MIRIGILKIALEELNNCNYYPYKVGAVIFKGSKILASGHNSIRTCSKIKPKFKQWRENLHAEQAAIIKLDWNKTKGSSILVLRCNYSSNILSIARPCDRCMELIEHVGIKNVFYSNRNGEIVKERI